MDYLKLLLGLLFVIGLSVGQKLSESRLIDDKVHIHVYYETQCPDSVDVLSSIRSTKHLIRFLTWSTLFLYHLEKRM